ncbi:MAG: DUF4268 domain-containing protein [Acidimicrobiia bacterium]
MTLPRTDPGFLAAYGEAIAGLRLQCGLDRRSLALDAGISYSYLSAIESGDRFPSPRVEAAIVEVLGVSAIDLLAAANGAVGSDITAQPSSPTEPGAVGSDRISEGAGRPHQPQTHHAPAVLSPSAAEAELRVLLPHLSPPDAATVVALARKLAQPSAQHRPHETRNSGDWRGPQLRTAAYLEFWDDYATKVSNRGLPWVDDRRPQPRNSFTMSSRIKGTSLEASFARNRLLRHGLSISRGSREASVAMLHRIRDHREAIESVYGRPLEFEEPARERGAVRIAEYRDGHISRTDEHGDYIEWFIDTGLRMRRAIATFVDLGSAR